jgi:hypothetical protein
MSPPLQCKLGSSLLISRPPAEHSLLQQLTGSLFVTIHRAADIMEQIATNKRKNDLHQIKLYSTSASYKRHTG